MELTDETKIKIMQNGLERTITLAELKEYMSPKRRRVVVKKEKPDVKKTS
jgi:hypothetical protein